MKRKFVVTANCGMCTPQKVTVTIDEKNLMEMRPLHSKTSYKIGLGTAVDIVVERIIKTDVRKEHKSK